MHIKAIRKHLKECCYLEAVHNNRVNETKQFFLFVFQRLGWEPVLQNWWESWQLCGCVILPACWTMNGQWAENKAALPLRSLYDLISLSLSLLLLVLLYILFFIIPQSGSDQGKQWCFWLTISLVYISRMSCKCCFTYCNVQCTNIFFQTLTLHCVEVNHSVKYYEVKRTMS